MEERGRAASVSSIDRLQEKDVMEAFKRGGIGRSPPGKKLVRETEKNKNEERDRGLEGREGKRRREPESMEDKMDRLLEVMMEKMDRVEMKVEEWKTRYDDLHLRIEEEQRQRLEEKQERDKEREQEQERMRKMQRQIECLEDKVDDLENRSRRANLVIKGLQEEKGETWAQSEKKVQEVLEKQLGLTGIDLVRAHRVGWAQGGRPRPIVVKFGREKERELVLQKKGKLKNTEVYIDEDYSAKLRTERRQLFEIVRKEQAQGKKARVRFNKIEIDGKLYKWSNEVKALQAVEAGQKNEKRRGN